MVAFKIADGWKAGEFDRMRRAAKIRFDLQATDGVEENRNK
jgi:hypothetical protein